MESFCVNTQSRYMPLHPSVPEQRRPYKCLLNYNPKIPPSKNSSIKSVVSPKVGCHKSTNTHETACQTQERKEKLKAPNTAELPTLSAIQSPPGLRGVSGPSSAACLHPLKSRLPKRLTGFPDIIPLSRSYSTVCLCPHNPLNQPVRG